MYVSSMFFLLLGSSTSLIMSLMSLYSGVGYFIEWEIVSTNSSSVVMTLILDWMSLMFLGFVMLISSMVLYYSGGYMEGDPNMNRFIYLVLMFVVSMVALIISPNLISILLGWDGLGLVSYCLVIYYQNEKSGAAGMLTALSNRVGDVAILLAISLMSVYGGWNFVFYLNSICGNESLGMLCFLVMLAAMTKSAQIPFSAWLPAAMAAPTPVSALVHSSTLVTAGVYLLVRFEPAMHNSVYSQGLLLLGGTTMFMAGLGANFEYDLKKIIALSTLSQLGVMMSILGFGLPDLAFFHLLSHALFKALLFMCAGVIIHSAKDYQDIRMMGGLSKFMPLTTFYMNLANLALCGMPFMAGFYSKDVILEMAFMGTINYISFLMYVFATGLTVCYTARLVYYSITGGFNMGSLHTVNDESGLLTSPMFLLALGAVSAGSMLSWLIVPYPYMICLSSFYKSLVLIVCMLGAWVGYVFNLGSFLYVLNSFKYYKSVVFSGSMWFMPFLSTQNMIFNFLVNGFSIYKMGDQGWFENKGGYNLHGSLMKSSGLLEKMQDNSIKLYMITFLFWAVLSIIIM
uniref:NADH-ubiquinone oxidoreductase chain 5 n=2 Tax=Gonodactylidae TaxID=75391 RepID=A0A8K1VV40_9CRUS|nr:NADH dehydrogenase subunit 5 [Gonodactylus smithii]QTK16226.1 NADH dehydrogenase subunit 5 [Gonodactylus smithii]UEV86996.1 NADH dehydrogenase subunit 5 [Gonodactylellus affinis]